MGYLERIFRKKQFLILPFNYIALNPQTILMNEYTKEMNVKNCRKIKLQTIHDGIDGVLTVAESHKNIPFDIARTYYIYDIETKNSIRGKHAHKKLEQVIFCIKGSFELLLDDGQEKETFVLNQPDVGIYMGQKVWHEMLNFSKDCMMLVFASDYYSEDDYLRNYSDFLHFISNK